MGKRASDITEYTTEGGIAFTVKEPSLRDMLKLSTVEDPQAQAEAVLSFIHSWDGMLPEDDEDILDVIPGRHVEELSSMLDDFFGISSETDNSEQSNSDES